MSQSALVIDPKNDSAYMTIREGNKVYRVPVMVVHDPTRQVEPVAAQPSRAHPVAAADEALVRKVQADSIRMHMQTANQNETKRGGGSGDPNKAMESMDGNWTMKSDRFSKKEAAAKRSLMLRNDAVALQFEPPEHVRKRESDGKNEIRRSKTPEPRSPYVREYDTMRSPKRQAPLPPGSASVYSSYPVGATLPRTRMRSEGGVTHVRTVYQEHPPPHMRSISVPHQHHYAHHRPPSPSSTIRDFEMSDDSVPSSPSSPVPLVSSSEIQVRNRYKPAVVGPVQTSTPPASTRIYIKRSHSDDSYHTGMSSRGTGRKVIQHDTYQRPGDTYGRSKSLNDNVDGRHVGEGRSPRSDPVVYRGEVVRVQVPAFKGNEEQRRKAPIPDEYHTYPQLMRKKNKNLNQSTTETTTTARDEHVRESTNFGSTQFDDNEQKATDLNANQIIEHVVVHRSSNGGGDVDSAGRSVSESEGEDAPMYSVAFTQHL